MEVVDIKKNNETATYYFIELPKVNNLEAC